MTKIAFALCAFALCACDAPQEPEQKTQGKYFQTYKSGVVHNSTCFWYGKSNGRYIDDPPHGRDCRKCGGRKSK